MKPANPLLSIEDLVVAYSYQGVWKEVVGRVSLQIEAGQVIGLVGESGSGKTTLAHAIMGCLGENSRIIQGKIVFDGSDLLSIDRKLMREIWGKQISLVPQNPLAALNPTLRIGEQIGELFIVRSGMARKPAYARVIQALEGVRITNPTRVAASYPHQLSGGMQQRVLIAMALSLTPRLLILDEPTTNLDVTTQASILELFDELIRASNTSVLYITHNLGVVYQFCTRLNVMYSGEIVEEGSTQDLLTLPVHPYTRALIHSLPSIYHHKRAGRLLTIPAPASIPTGNRSGCYFAPRCSGELPVCSMHPKLDQVLPDRNIRCHRWESFVQNPVKDNGSGCEAYIARKKEGQPEVLSIKNLSIEYRVPGKSNIFLGSKMTDKLRVIDQLRLQIQPGVTLGLVGESGSGKTSLARAIVGLVEPSSGTIELEQNPLVKLSKRSRATLGLIQMVSQNPDEALNPHQTIGEALSRPLITLQRKTKAEARQTASRLLKLVNLSQDYIDRLPGELSGGEKQRVAIARALAVEPKLIIADEPVSFLDASVQASILNLLADLQSETGSSMLFISHDLAVVGYIADMIAVLYQGKLLEITPAGNLKDSPHHPYTMSLLASLPQVGKAVHSIRNKVHSVREDYAGKEDIDESARPSFSDDVRPLASSGCTFAHRCPLMLGEICQILEPPWQVGSNDTKVKCHIPIDVLANQMVRG